MFEADDNVSVDNVYVASMNGNKESYQEAQEITDKDYLESFSPRKDKIQPANVSENTQNVFHHYLATCVNKNTKTLEKMLAVLDKPVVEKPPAPTRSNVTTVELMVAFIKIEDIHTLKQQFEAEIIIRAKWEEPHLNDFNFTPEEWLNFDFGTLWNPKLKVINIIGAPSVDTEWYQTSFQNYGRKHPLVVYYKKLKAVFSEPLELDCFPIDSQELNVQISCDLPKGEVLLVEDTNNLSFVETKNFMDKQEFLIYDVVDSSIHERECSEFEEPNLHSVLKNVDTKDIRKRSQINFTCYVARRPNFYVWNILVVMFIIITLSFMTFSMSGQNGFRLGNNFTLLLTVVAFKFIVNNHIPQVSYLTYLEIYIICQLMFLVCVIVENAVIAWIWNYRSEELARLVDYILLGILLGYYIFYHLGYLIFFIRKRSVLTKELIAKEESYLSKQREFQQFISHQEKRNVKSEYRNGRSKIFPLKK